MKLFSQTDVARFFGVPPRRIPDLFYQGKLDVDRCEVIGGRRLIPESYLPEVKQLLRETDDLQGDLANAD